MALLAIGLALAVASGADGSAAARRNQPPEANAPTLPGRGEAALAAEPAPEEPPDSYLLPPENPSPEIAAAAVPPSPKRNRRPHWGGIGLAVGAAVSAGFAIVGLVRVIQYDQIPVPAKTWPQYGEALALKANTQNWGNASILLGLAAATWTTGAVFAW